MIYIPSDTQTDPTIPLAFEIGKHIITDDRSMIRFTNELRKEIEAIDLRGWLSIGSEKYMLRDAAWSGYRSVHQSRLYVILGEYNFHYRKTIKFYTA